VYEAWQRNGVARALTQHALEATGELRLVACKPSRGFYPRAGFEVVDWDLIAARIAYDCDRCVARQACNPVPFRRRHQACQGDACQGDAGQGDVSLDTQRRVQ
jgi:N-acetylglutamate synthase-like GNAT family acetyltransferase